MRAGHAATANGRNTEIKPRYDVLVSDRPRTFLEPGHEAKWEALNREKRELLRPAPNTPVEELLRRGQRLSIQAARFRRAVDGSNDRT